MVNMKFRLSVLPIAKEVKPLELKIGFSFVSIDNAKMNLEQEMKDKSFAQVRKAKKCHCIKIYFFFRFRNN